MESSVQHGNDPQNMDCPNELFDINNGPVSLELGRESLGILPAEFGRESLGFSNPAFLEEIQSSGLNSFLQLSVADRESLNGARESLGILQLSSLEAVLSSQNSKTPDLLLTTINENETACDILNKAFIFPSPKKFSVTSSCSHLSFNANSIEEPSKIYSIPSFNDVFSNTMAISKPNIFNNSKSLGLPETHVRLRIQSLPNMNNRRTELFPKTEMSSITSILNEGKLFSLLETDSLQMAIPTKNMGSANTEISPETNTIEILDCQENENINLKEANDNEFHDSVFIEGKYFAEKIANKSILNNSFNNEVGILDNIPHPDWVDLPTSPKNDLEVGVIHEIIPMLESEESESGKLTDTETESKLNSSKTDQTSKSAKELLHNLSEIVNNTTQSDQQRSKGQYLLNRLADLLSSGSNNRSCILDDSGHSSSINDISDPEKIQTSTYSAALDFSQTTNSLEGSQGNDLVNKSMNPRIKSKSIEKNSKQLSSSLNSALPAKNTQPRLLNRGSLSRVSFDNSKNRTCSTNSSVKSENSSISNSLTCSLQSNLKVKMTKDASRKGPLKAVIPVKDLKKITRAGTPERMSQMMQSSRTSTPIHEPKLKPMAASTPTHQPILKNISGRKSMPSSSKIGLVNKHSDIGSSSSSSVKSRKVLPICTSPLAGNSNVSVNKQNLVYNFAKSPKSSSTKDKISGVSQLPILSQESFSRRRNSITSFKNEQTSQRPRSNSLPKEPVGLMSSIGKIRENLLNSPEFKQFTVLKENNGTNEPVSKKSALLHSKTELLPKFKKADKENIKK